jgi:hypothetical protein
LQCFLETYRLRHFIAFSLALPTVYCNNTITCNRTYSTETTTLKTSRKEVGGKKEEKIKKV